MHADWVFSVFNGSMEYIANNEIRLTILTHEISLSVSHSSVVTVTVTHTLGSI